MTAVMDTPALERELVITRVIDAPRERLFEAWTQPELLVQWWGPHGMTTPICRIDLRPGRIFLTVMRAPDGTEYYNEGVYLEIVENERIVFTDAYGADWMPAEHPFMTGVTTFEEIEGGKTKYTSRALHWTVADRKKHEEMGFHQGWGESLDRLEALVTKGAEA